MLNRKSPLFLGLLVLFMFALRVGYKYYHSQQQSQAQLMENADARRQALIESIQANQDAQRANGARVVADSAGAAVAVADTIAQGR